MISKVKEYLTKYEMINPGDTVIAGVSGGADSTCMLLSLLEYKKIVDFDLKVVHINHLIRKEAKEDADFVGKICEKEGISFTCFEDDVEKIAKELGMSVEEAGRKVRYEHFREIAKDTGKIAVAHNKNDVAETVLFNIFRGTGLEGLSSLEPVNGQIIRPLLGVTRKEIEEYLKTLNQEFCTDCTNNENEYARNKIRNVILPFAEDNLVTNATEHVAMLSEKMQKVKTFLKTETNKVFSECVDIKENMATINLNKLMAKEEVLVEEVLLLAIEKLTPHRKDITSAHIEAIKGIIDKSGEKKVDLPYNLEAIKSYETLYIREVKEKESTYYNEVIEEGEYILPDNRVMKVRIFDYDESCDIPQKSYTKWFDYDKISSCVTLRNRCPKDYLTVNKDLSKKLLKDYFIDEKIPKENRDTILVLADASHIIWVIGYRISEYYKVTGITKRVLEISIQ